MSYAEKIITPIDLENDIVGDSLHLLPPDVQNLIERDGVVGATTDSGYHLPGDDDYTPGVEIKKK